MVVALNNGSSEAVLDVPAAPAGLSEGSRLRDCLGPGGEAAVVGGRVRLTLQPRSGAVLVPMP